MKPRFCWRIGHPQPQTRRLAWHRLAMLFLTACVLASHPGAILKRALAAESPAARASAGAVQAGALTISRGWSRATPPGARVGGGYLSIHNGGSQSDRLIGAKAAFAPVSEVHEMRREGDVMRMRALESGLEIPPGATIDLSPNGYHLMFIQLERPLVEGETGLVELVFERAGRVTIPLAIGGRGAQGPVGEAASPPGQADPHAHHHAPKASP